MGRKYSCSPRAIYEEMLKQKLQAFEEKLENDEDDESVEDNQEDESLYE